MGLFGKFGLLGLVPLMVLGLVLSQLLRGQMEKQALTDAREAAALTSRLGIQPLLSPTDLREGVSFEHLEALDAAVRAGKQDGRLVRMKVWSPSGEIVFSDNRTLIGRRQPASEDLKMALAGQVFAEVEEIEGAEYSGEGLRGAFIETYVPLRFSPGARPAGAIELYLSYAPVEAAIQAGTRSIYVAIAVTLLLLYAALFRIAAGASRTLRGEAAAKEHQALHDPLTSLPNRLLLHDRIERAVAAAGRDGHSAALMLLDVDHFKEVNDTLGHHAGDLLLKELAIRLREALREVDTVARLGGDEFAVLLPEIRDAATAGGVATKLLERLEAPFVLGEISVNVEASVGIALSPAHGDDVETLVRRADVAMYLAKDARTGYEVYDPERDHHSPARLALLGDLRRALDEGGLGLHYQPKADLKSGEVVGVEALLRWEHPVHGPMAPGDFLPMVERTALMRPLTLHILDTALRQAAEWREGGLEIGMAVNIAMPNLLDSRLPEDVAGILERCGVPPEVLELEVTENSFMADVPLAVANLTALSEMGVRLSMDDFGTGYASLAYLRGLPLDEVKIDRSFVMRMAGSTSDSVIVESTIDLGRNLGLRVVAEGVESAEAWSWLGDRGCDLAQGFFLSRPKPAEEMTRWLLASRDRQGAQEHEPA